MSASHRVGPLVVKRIIRELGWSITVLCVFTSGLTGWILVPSVASSLQSGLGSYASGAAGYVVVVPGQGDCPFPPVPGGCPHALPAGAVTSISSINGVDKVYPVIENITFFILPGDQPGITRINMGTFSTVLGGSMGFPSGLLTLASGRYPNNAPEFVYGGSSSLLNKSAASGPLRTFISCYGCPATDSGIPQYSPQFNSTGVGRITLNPLFKDIEVIWNSTFLQQVMGQKNYAQTFGGANPNYLIIKVSNVAYLPRVANETAKTIQPYQWFGVRYDQALAQSLQSFASQTAPLYEGIGAVSIVAVIGISYLTSRVVAGRRDWEAGLLMSQGWKWREIQLLYTLYFLVLSSIAFAVAALISAELSQLFVTSYQIFATEITVKASIDPLFLASGAAFAILLAVLSSYTITRRLKKMSLDNLLREY